MLLEVCVSLILGWSDFEAFSQQFPDATSRMFTKLFTKVGMFQLPVGEVVEFSLGQR